MHDFRCLAIETATERASVALCGGDEIRLHALAVSRNSSRELYQAIRQLFAEADFAPVDLHCIAVGRGPGSFTGVRVAMAAAQGLAYALEKPVCAVSTLAAQAAVAARECGAGSYAVALDARMGEAYLGLYTCAENDRVQALMADALVQPDKFLLERELDGIGAVGQGWEVYPQLLTRNRPPIVREVIDIWPDAAAVLGLARRMYKAGDVLTAARALPNYLRNNVAQRAAPTQ